jgi:Fur family ferric uptake transcriptional regulator
VRLTSVRARLLQAICTFEGHFRAEDIAERLRRTGTPVSLVTVYRNLPLLERTGVIRRTCLTRGAASYERTWQSRHHDHLICTRCGKVVEFEYRAIDVLQEVAAAEHGFQLTGHHLELLGRCPTCRAKEPR